MPDHDKRVALVTGANRGIGYAISHLLGEQNITVILGARDPSKGAAACSRLQGEGLDVHFELLDVSDENSIKKAIESIRAQFGRFLQRAHADSVVK
jgi:NAD(P)-dependent dehydrogenase (short-subunit alcohol dehydrogenase family)